MTTAKRLQLMFVITVLFGLSSIFSIVQLSKATQFHHINFLYIANVLKLHEELSNYPKTPLNTENIIKILSVGIAYSPKNGLDSSTLLKRADIAMYEAKANGKNQYHTYEEDSINHKTEHRLTLEKDLRSSIEKDELLLHYQPVINLENLN
ncbi:MAG: diguanylate cyclase [Proteobacteria bacterium]|nr:diguanylate cyclase [Pseudomonadota bacterium]